MVYSFGYKRTQTDYYLPVLEFIFTFLFNKSKKKPPVTEFFAIKLPFEKAFIYNQ